MQRINHRIKQSLATLALISAILLSPQAAFAKDSVKVMPPSSKVQGKSYAEWSAAWWQWALGMPIDQNPFFDENGSCAHGGNGQSGKIWYLTGVYNASGRAERNCTIPEDKFLFFPIVNLECDTLTPPTIGGSAAALSACSRSYPMTNLVAEVDGIAVPHLDRYFVKSPIFPFTLPTNNVLNLSAGPGKAVSYGAWLMLAPLEKGQHTIHFGGSVPAFQFTLDITYHLTVK